MEIKGDREAEILQVLNTAVVDLESKSKNRAGVFTLTYRETTTVGENERTIELTVKSGGY